MNINRCECRERTIRASHDGTEIVRTFYVDPYEAHPVVLSALLGAVESDGVPQRRKPAEDSWYSNFYCTDAWVEQVDQAAMSASPSLGVYPPGDYSAEQLREYISANLDDSSKEIPGGITIRTRGHNDAQSTSDAGCFIRAVFKPLIHELPDWSSGDSGFATPDAFDFVDPLLIPLTKTASTGIGLKYLVPNRLPGGAIGVPGLLGVVNLPWFTGVGSEGFVVQPMWQFTIRRLMVANPPLTTINRLKGKINGLNFYLGKYRFQPETLRFDDCEVVKRAVPWSDGETCGLTVWYDLLYVFTWNTIWEEYFSYEENKFKGPGYVGWNRILGLPMSPKSGIPIGSPDPDPADIILKDAPLSYYPVGWKSRIFQIGGYRNLYLADKNDPPGPGTYQGGTEHGFYDLFNFSLTQ